MSKLRWNKHLLAELKAMYNAGMGRGETKSYVIMEIADKLNFPQNMVAYQIAKMNGEKKPKWSQEEVEIVKTINRTNFKRENVEKLMPLLPGRTYTEIRSKIYYCCGIKMDRITSKKRREYGIDSEAKTLDQVMLGTDSIYDKAAKLIGGVYKNGIITKNGRPLTGSQTMKLLAEARQNYP